MKKIILVLILLYTSIVPAFAGFSITLNSPENNTITNDNLIKFNYKVIGSENQYNCSLYIDGSYNSNFVEYEDDLLVDSDGVTNPSYASDDDWGTCAYRSAGSGDGILEIELKVMGTDNQYNVSKFDWVYKVKPCKNFCSGCSVASYIYLYLYNDTSNTYNEKLTRSSVCYAGYCGCCGYYGEPYEGEITVYEDELDDYIRGCYYGWANKCIKAKYRIHIAGTSCWTGGYVYESKSRVYYCAYNNTSAPLSPSNPLPDGTHTWYINCSAGGEVNVSEIRTIKIDTTPPTTTIYGYKEDGSDYSFNTWTNSDYINITLSCSDSVSGCNITKYCIDTTNSCSPNETYNGTITINSEGEYYIRYYSKDNVNNQESINSKIIKIDKTNPTINWLKLIVDNLGKNNLISLIVNAYDLHINTAKFDTITNSSWSNNQTILDINDLLSQSGTVYVNDSATNLDTYILNYTLTNNSYYQNTSFNANLSEQRIYKNDTLYNYANNNLTYHITHYNKSASTLITGGTFTGELAGNSNINLYSEWSGDWLSETEDTYTYFQNTSKTSNLSKQYLINQTYLNITNLAINFTDIDISSMCENTLVVNLSVGNNQITNCSYVEWSGDWLSETWLPKEQDISKTSNLSKQYLRHRLNVSNTIDVNFTNVNWLFDNPISGETLTTYTGTVDIPANSYNDTEYAYGYGDWLYEIDSQYTANLTEAGGNAWIKRDINNTIDINFTNIQNIGREGWTCTKQTINISANQFIENATICNKTNVITKQQSNNTIYNDTVVVDSYVDAYYWVSGSNTDTINYSNVLVQTTLPDWATNTSPYIFSINLNSGGTYNLMVNITGKPAVETGYTFTKTQIGGGEKNIYLGTIEIYDSAVSEKEIWYYIPKSRLLNYEGGVSKTYMVDDRTSGFSVQETDDYVIIKIPTDFS